jgi:pimeloyl-ACP methyl ester carboxylesterase
MSSGPDPTPRIEGTYELADGRRVGFAEYGDPEGRPVLWFHGTPGGRRQIAPAGRRLAGELGVRLIALERPGIGASTLHVHADVRGWADDVGEIADRLGLGRFAAIGLSGGGPYVLACAAVHPDRMVAGAVLGGVAPTRGIDAAPGGAVDLAVRLAPLLEYGARPLGVVAHRLVRLVQPLQNEMFELYARLSPPGDQEVFRRPEMRAMFLDDLGRASRRQLHAPILDLLLFTRPWGFALSELSVPIRFWHGDADPIVPLAHAEHMAALVPGASLTVRPGESHLGALDASAEIFDVLLGLWAERDQGPDPAARTGG